MNPSTYEAGLASCKQKGKGGGRMEVWCATRDIATKKKSISRAKAERLKVWTIPGGAESEYRWGAGG